MVFLARHPAPGCRLQSQAQAWGSQSDGSPSACLPPLPPSFCPSRLLVSPSVHIHTACSLIHTLSIVSGAVGTQEPRSCRVELVNELGRPSPMAEELRSQVVQGELGNRA